MIRVRLLLLHLVLMGAFVLAPGFASWAQISPTPSPSSSNITEPVTITVNKRVLEIGQSLRVQVEISNAENADLKPVKPDKWDIKPFELQDSALAELPAEQGRHRVRFTLRAACFEEGEQAFPAITLDYTKDGEAHQADSEPFRVMINKVPSGKDDKPGEIRGVKEFQDSPFPPVLIALIIATILLLVWALYRTVKWLRRPQPIKAAPAVHPYDWARTEFDRIEREKIWQEGKFELFYDELTLVLRQYLGWRFKMALLEKTTSETLDALKLGPGFDYDAWKELRMILEEADLVKFARLHPPSEKAIEQLTQARDLVERFKPNQAAPPKATPTPNPQTEEVKSA